MTTRKPTETESAPHETPARKVWKKKSPFEVFLNQEEKLRSEISETEALLASKREQLTKFEQARKIFES